MGATGEPGVGATGEPAVAATSPGPAAGIAYVFGYASLVAFAEPLVIAGELQRPVPGRLRGFRRHWGAAMDNWEGGEEAKHFLDRASGERPRIRAAYLDLEPLGPEAGRAKPAAVNGLALPVDADRLAALDAREINYERADVSASFEPASQAKPPAVPTQTDPVAPPEAGAEIAALRAGTPVFAYLGTPAARERARRGREEGNAYVSRDYLAGVRSNFAALGEEALVEFTRTTEPPPFPEADLQVVNAPLGY